jgi:DNA-binding transcriptional MerR regulator
LGLLPEPAWTISVYRVYGVTAVKRPLLIKQAKEPGLSLDEIKEIKAKSPV